jgi:hypothetical protein
MGNEFNDSIIEYDDDMEENCNYEALNESAWRYLIVGRLEKSRDGKC